MEPPLLLADEPTGNLDAGNAAMVNDLILRLTSELRMASVVVTHNARLARMMDRGLELAGGRLKSWSGSDT
jgi:ABC-type lipoprotein export system ATPase subunit